MTLAAPSVNGDPWQGTLVWAADETAATAALDGAWSSTVLNTITVEYLALGVPA